MDFADVVRRRRMIRNYTDEPVERAVLARIMRRARSAPSAGFSQGVRFVVVTEAATRARIAALADEPYYVEHGYEPWISHAPVHVVVALREQDYHDRYTEPEKLEDGEEIEWPAPWWWVDARVCGVSRTVSGLAFAHRAPSQAPTHRRVVASHVLGNLTKRVAVGAIRECKT
ncbi:MAG: nitroreductase family protein [Thermoleophilia bacterium]|nr:nitroreductase family protein [Thermoleophilia bacterium]